MPRSTTETVGRMLIVFSGILCSFVSICSGGSPIVLTADDRSVCAVNQDCGSISIWEWTTEREPVEIAVGAEPRMLAVSSNGQQIYVTTQRSQELVIVDLGSKSCTARIPLGGQPVGISVSRNGRHAFVAQFAGDYLGGIYHEGIVAKVDLERQTIEKSIPVKSRPFAMLRSSDGRHLYVSHYFQIAGSGWVSEIDLDEFRLVREFEFKEDADISGGSGGVFNALAGLALHPHHNRLLVAGMHANVRRGLSQSGRKLSHKTTVQAAVRVVDLDEGVEIDSARMVSSFSGQAVAVPSAVTFLPDGRHFIDLYFASQDMKILAYNELGTVAERALFALPEGPNGIVVTRDGKHALVNCRWSRSIAHVSLKNNRNPQLIQNRRVAAELWDQQRLLGAKIFHNTRDQRMTPNRWLSCGVCHLDGGVLSDNLLWEFTADQKRSSPRIVNTKSLAVTDWSGPPYLIKGTYQSIHEEDKFVRSFLKGNGFLNKGENDGNNFPDDPFGQSAELDAVSRYVLSLRPRPNPHLSGNLPRQEILASARRGKTLFHSDKLGCYSCHYGRYLTRSGHNEDDYLVDVGTGIRADVPSLINLWETAPYLHDGRAATLRDVLTRFNPHDQHGRTSHLNAKQIDDLINFLLAPFADQDG